MKEKNIEVIILEPNKQPVVKTIKNELEVLQELVGGYIECVRADGYDIVINEEGKLNDLEPNFMIYGGADYIAGTAVFVGVDYSEGEFKSLSKGQIMAINMYFERRKAE